MFPEICGENSKNKKDINKKRHITKKKNGSYGKSKSEDKYFEYLKENLDPNVERQAFHKGFNIDFYSPKYDIYIQFDGDYWHGYLNTKEELMKGKQGRYILKVIEKDKEQNQLIDNLIRIRESEFLKEML